MKETLQGLRTHWANFRPHGKIFLLIAAALAVLAGISTQLYAHVSQSSVMLMICLIISLFGRDTQNSHFSSQFISGRYVFVVASYAIWFAILLCLAKMWAWAGGNGTALTNGLLCYVAQSFWGFSFVCATQMAICYKKGGKGAPWVIVPLLLLELSPLVWQTGATFTHPFLAAATFIAMSCLVWFMSYKLSLKFYQAHVG